MVYLLRLTYLQFNFMLLVMTMMET